MAKGDQTEDGEDTERARAYEEGPTDGGAVGERAKVAPPDHKRRDEQALQDRVVPVESAPEMKKWDDHEQPERQCPGRVLATEKKAVAAKAAAEAAAKEAAEKAAAAKAAADAKAAAAKAAAEADKAAESATETEASA